MSTQNTNPNRVPAGVTTGGQFSTGTRAEPDVSLAPQEQDMTGAQLMAHALSSTQHHARMSNLRFTSIEDLSQDTIVQVLRKRKEDASTVITAKYVHTVARGFVAINARGNLNANDRKAIGIYQDRIDTIEATEGRRLTPIERDAIAKNIRDSWEDQRHKPSIDFVTRANRGGNLSLDATVGDGTSTFMDIVAERTAYQDHDQEAVDPNSATAKALQLVNDKQKAEAKAVIWDVMREQNPNLPPALEQQVPRSEGIKHLKTIKERKPEDKSVIAKGIEDWNRGNDDTDACRALFAPFGNISPDEKDAVADLFNSHKAFAEDMYKQIMNQAMEPALTRVRRSAA